MRALVVVFLLAVAITQSAYTQEEPSPESLQAAHALLEVSANTEYIPAQAYFPCRVLLPEGYDPVQEYPLVIGLHGFGSYLDRFATLWYALDDPQFILAVPQAPYTIPPEQGGGASWLPKEDLDPERWNEASVWTQDYVLEAADSLTAVYSVDHTYLIGFSQGGMLAYTIALSQPDLFAGVAGIGSLLPPDWVSEEQIAAAQELRVFTAHSPEDGAVPIALAQETRDRLEGAGLEVEYMEYSGGHTISAEVLAALDAWLAVPGMDD